MSNILKIKLVDDAGISAASGKQLAYIESLCGDLYRNEFLQFMGNRTTKDATKHISMINATLWIKCLRNHIKFKFEEVNNNI